MSQSKSNDINSTSKLDNSTPNIDFELFLNLISCPAIFINDNGRILAFNSLFAEFTGCKKTEINQKSVSDFLDISSKEDLHLENSSIKQLIRSKDERINVRVNYYPFSMDQKIKLVTFIQEEKSDNFDKYEDDLLGAMGQLISLFNETDIHKIYEKVIESASDLLETNDICIYQAESAFPRLIKAAAQPEENIFPQTLSITELIRLAGVTVWTPEKRLFSEIHRAGRNANLSYVASMALGDETAKIGLLVVGSKEKQLLEKVTRVLSFLGTLISTVLQHRYLISNLRDEQSNDKHTIYLFDQILEASSEGILIVSPSMTLQRINPAAEMMLGYSDWEILDKEVESILVGPEGLWQALQDATNGIPTHDLGSVSLHRRNGQAFPAIVQILPVIFDDVLVNILIFIRDISEHEQYRIRTQQLEHRALLGVFTAIFAHEVRNPINNISTGLQLLSTNLHPTDPNQELVNRIQADCVRLNQLMESVLAYARPMETKFEKLDLKFLLTRILDRWHPRLTRLGIQLFFNSDENLPMVMGNSRALDQVFTNLITNAVEAMQDTGGTLGIQLKRVAVNPKRTWVEISISDNGHGIPDEIKDRIFEPFVSTSQRGTGLGLAITKNIITAHRGSINLSSFPGGTVFQIHLLAVEGDTIS